MRNTVGLRVCVQNDTSYKKHLFAFDRVTNSTTVPSVRKMVSDGETWEAAEEKQKESKQLNITVQLLPHKETP